VKKKKNHQLGARRIHARKKLQYRKQVWMNLVESNPTKNTHKQKQMPKPKPKTCKQINEPLNT
jgi:hypothetical protein